MVSIANVLMIHGRTGTARRKPGAFSIIGKWRESYCFARNAGRFSAARTGCSQEIKLGRIASGRIRFEIQGASLSRSKQEGD